VQDNEKFIENDLLQDVKTFKPIYETAYWDSAPETWDDNYAPKKTGKGKKNMNAAQKATLKRQLLAQATR
jgi:hypothetical protein